MFNCLKIIVFLFTLQVSSFSTAQKNIELSKKEMYEDFDYLVCSIENTNPYLEIKKKLFKYSILDSIFAERSKIEKCNSLEDFQLLIKRVLNLCLDGHTVLLTPFMHSNLNLYLPLTYHNGNYFVKQQFAYNNVNFMPGYKLIAINGNYDIHTEIKNQIPNRYQMRWDIKNQRFYSELFYLSDEYINKGYVELAFKNEQDTIVQKFWFKDSITREKIKRIDQKKVEYFNSEKILYIRVPAMNWEDRKYFPDEIQKVAGTNLIDKIVIDVRYNLGGSSIVGRNIMQSIIDEPIQIPTKIYGNQNFKPSYFYKKNHGFKKSISAIPVKVINNLNMTPLIDGNETLEPFKNSIKHTGDIYILGNEHIYSAAGAMFTFANLSKSDKIYSIGTPTGWFLGEFTDPIKFKLPNSQLELIVSASMAMTNVDNWNNIMLDQYDYTIPCTPENYAIFYSQSDSLYTKEYLLNQDPYFKPILE